MLIQKEYNYCKAAQSCLVDIEEKGRSDLLPRLENLLKIIEHQGKKNLLVREFSGFLDAYLTLKKIDRIDGAMSLTFIFYTGQIIKEMEKNEFIEKTIKPILKKPGTTSTTKKQVRFWDI